MLWPTNNISSNSDDDLRTGLCLHDGGGVFFAFQWLQDLVRKRKNILIGNVLLIDRAEPAHSSHSGDGAVAADGLDLTKLVHECAVRMACRAVRRGDQHRTVERTQSQMWHKPAQLDKYVETG
ncbi:hypothetical protein ACVWYH_005673 [Bradyrhizobium sp. GM24.11]